MRKKANNVSLLTALCFLLVLSGCKKEELVYKPASGPAYPTVRNSNLGQAKNHSTVVATKWFDLELNLIKSTPGFTPPVASRALGYTGVTLYESLVNGMEKYTSLQSKLDYQYVLPVPHPNVSYHWPAVANAAMKTIVERLFPTTSVNNKSSIINLFNEVRESYSTEINSTDLAKAETYGDLVALAIFEWSKTDGGHEGYLNNTPTYILPVFSGAWVPTAPAFQPIPVQANWGNNRPFFPGSVDNNCIPPAPPASYSKDVGSDFYSQAMEVYKTGINLTQAQKDIASFWSDGGGTITPPGHTMNIATQMIRSSNMNLEEAGVAYAKMGMAIADAFIACWKGKYKFNLMRPISYIQQNIDPKWNSFIVTPPFPTYCSGHATVSGASAEVLTQLFGDKKKFTDYSHEKTLGVRTYKSFYEAAEEAAISRLYGGIHFRMDNEIGLEKGKIIGKNIAAIKLKK